MDILERIKHEREERRKRDLKIVAAWESGQQYAEIGRVFSLSRATVKDRIKRYFREKQRQDSDDPFQKISSRTLKILQREGLMTVAMVVEKYHRNELLTIRNFGRKSMREIEKWFPVMLVIK